MVRFIFILMFPLLALADDDFLGEAMLRKEIEDIQTQIETIEGYKRGSQKYIFNMEDMIKSLGGLKLDSESKKELLIDYEQRKKRAQENLEQWNTQKSIFDKKMERTKLLKEDYSLIKKNPSKIICNASSPEINLEQETPFPEAEFKGFLYQVPRDNQDGLGTCYANVARILLLGASNGNVDASFLDAALHYKMKKKQISKDGLDGGNACEVISVLKETGYCPQDEAPLEAGEHNPLIDLIVGNSDDDIFQHSFIYSQIQDFIAAREMAEKAGPLPESSMMKKAKFIIQEMKENLNIKLPLPVARFQIPPMWKLRATYYSKLSSLNVKQEDFLAEHRDRYKKFFPKYLSYLNQNKSREFIFNEFIKENQDFVDKYHLKDEMKDWLNWYLKDSSEDYSSKKFKKSFDESLNFLKKISDKEELSNEEYIQSCGENFFDEFEMINKLRPLVKKLVSKKVDPFRLIDERGDLKSGAELMQLAIAPRCLHPENRKKIEAPISCVDYPNVMDKIKKSDLPKESQIKVMRERVLLSLLQGLPLGNSFKTGGSTGHINAIVGMRFNQTTNQCEYLIRESQDGTSKWTEESSIFEKINELVEVRKWP